MTNLMFQYLTAGKIFGNPSLVDLNDLSWLIDQNLNEIEKSVRVVRATWKRNGLRFAGLAGGGSRSSSTMLSAGAFLRGLMCSQSCSSFNDVASARDTERSPGYERAGDKLR